MPTKTDPPTQGNPPTMDTMTHARFPSVPLTHPWKEKRVANLWTKQVEPWLGAGPARPHSFHILYRIRLQRNGTCLCAKRRNEVSRKVHRPKPKITSMECALQYPLQFVSTSCHCILQDQRSRRSFVGFDHYYVPSAVRCFSSCHCQCKRCTPLGRPVPLHLFKDGRGWQTRCPYKARCHIHNVDGICSDRPSNPNSTTRVRRSASKKCKVGSDSIQRRERMQGEGIEQHMRWRERKEGNETLIQRFHAYNDE